VSQRRQLGTAKEVGVAPPPVGGRENRLIY